MSQLYVDNIKGRTGGAVGFPTGMVVTGVSTFSNAVSIAGTLTYDDVTNIDSVGIITAQAGVNVTGGALNVGSGITISTSGVNVTGVITATNVSAGSSVTATNFYGTNGVNVTAGGVKVTAGGVDVTAGGLNVTAGISTFAGDVSIGDSITHSGDNTAIRFPAADTFTVETAGSERLRVTSTGGIHFNNAELIERVKITAGKLSDNQNINLDNGMIHHFTTAESTTATPNIVSSAGINTNMAIGDAISVTIVTTAAAAGYAATVNIDGQKISAGQGSLNWTGGSAPSDGGASGVDIYAYTLIKTADAKFTVIATQTKTS